MEALHGAGAADVQRVLRVGYKASTAARAVVAADGAVRIEGVFGPRVVTNVSGAGEALRSRMVRIGTAPVISGSRWPPDGGSPDLPNLRDDLHAWGMLTTPALAVAAAPAAMPVDRAAEIAVPLLAVGRLAGPEWEARVATAIKAGDRPKSRFDPEEVFREALVGLGAAGVGHEVSMLQTSMQFALAAAGAARDGAEVAVSPEWIGARLAVEGVREATGSVARRRLFGVITRIYPLTARWRAQATGPAPVDAFAFCASNACSVCRYRDVCSDVAPGLRRGKARAIAAARSTS